MLLAKTGDTALVHYTAKLNDGTVVDSSLNRGKRPRESELKVAAVRCKAENQNEVQSQG